MLKTKREKFVCFEGIEIVKAREALGLTQGEMAERCDWSIHFQVNHEQPVKYIVIPDDAKIMYQSTYQLLLDALKE